MRSSPSWRIPIATLGIAVVSLAVSLGVDGYLSRSMAREGIAATPAPVAAATASPTVTRTASPIAVPSILLLPEQPPSAPPAATGAAQPAPSPESAAADPARAPAAPMQEQPVASSTGRGPNTSDKVVLTYDDCPKSKAAFQQVVLSAEQQGVSLALFPTGQCLSSSSFDAGFARAHGHYVFNHSVSHPQFSKLSQARIEAQLRAPGVETSWGRPPYGELNATIRAAYAAVDMRIWTWTVDTLDWKGRSEAAIVTDVVEQAKPGDTVLMHMQHAAFTPDAISRMVSGLNARGIAVCANHGPTEQSPATLSC